MRLATWNINSVRLRIDLVTSFLKSADVDVLCLQETKTEDAYFPADALIEAGWAHDPTKRPVFALAADAAPQLRVLDVVTQLEQHAEAFEAAEAAGDPTVLQWLESLGLGSKLELFSILFGTRIQKNASPKGV